MTRALGNSRGDVSKSSIKACYQIKSTLAGQANQMKPEMEKNKKSKFWKNLLGGGRTSAGGLLTGGTRQLKSLMKPGCYVQLFISASSDDLARITKVIYHLPTGTFPANEIEVSKKEQGFSYEIFTSDPFTVAVDIYSIDDKKVETIETSRLDIDLSKEKVCAE